MGLHVSSACDLRDVRVNHQVAPAIVQRNGAAVLLPGARLVCGEDRLRLGHVVL